MAPSRLRGVALGTLAALLLAGLAPAVADPDVWHEMAWAREAWQRGELLHGDPFSYTSTVSPLVHHEWGMGVLVYAAHSVLGLPGLLLVRYALVALLAVLVWRSARGLGASSGVQFLSALIAIPLVVPWMGTVRAQLFTLVASALLLRALHGPPSRADHPLSIGLLFLVWLNVHAGFVAGVGLLGLHVAEQLVRRRPLKRLLLTLVVVLAVVPLNPWGLDYLHYLARAIPMPRPTIAEWGPIHEARSSILVGYGAALALLAYTLRALGPRRVGGALLLVALALLAARHQRHASLFGVAWLILLPPALARTPLGRLLTELPSRYRAWLTPCGVLLIPMLLVAAALQRPWHVKLTGYPVEAVRHLAEVEFRGRLVTPFERGAFVTWELYPDVLVSLDGRYEVAYPEQLLAEHTDFYMGRGAWSEFLERTGSDAALVPAGLPVMRLLEQDAGWRLSHRDADHSVFVRRR